MEATIKINRQSLCGYLKKIFINEGERGLKRYQDYLSKENSKKRNSLDRMLELNQMIDTCNWWIKTVKPHIDTNKEKEKIWKRETAKERRILDYFQNQLEEGIITLQDVKSPIYREYLLEASLPF